MDALEFRILGPIEATVAGRVAALGGRRVRQVLAVLLLHVGRPVTTERFIDLVWDDDPPATVRTQLAIQISALRRAFGKTARGHDVIETTAAGYRMAAKAVRIDAAEAERAWAEARTLPDREAAAERLRAALALWRGPALAGLSTRGLTASARRLDELRLSIAEDLYDIELELGRHRAQIGELSALVAEEPLRERLRAQLMTALWRSGRHAEALEAFREGRRLLVDELAIEPGAELRELNRAILADDRSRPAREPAGNSARPAAVVPAELPADVPGFTGRAAQAARLRARLITGGAPTVALAGPGGVGKSALAVHLGHRVADAFPDGQLYVNLHGSTPGAEPLRPAGALARLLRSLGVDDASIPLDEDEAAGRFRSMTEGRRLLLVLDNAVDGAQVAPLLPASRSCRVIVTSRRILAELTSAVHERLAPPPETDAVRMLLQMLGPDRADRAAAASVARLCDRLPLALSIAASRLIHRPAWTLRTLAERLGCESRRLDELETGARAVRTAFDVAYRKLDAAERRMFRLIGLLDGATIDVRAAGILAGIADDSAEELLESLVDAQLVESRTPGGYHLPQLVRLYARECASEEPAGPLTCSGAGLAR